MDRVKHGLSERLEPLYAVPPDPAERFTSFTLHYRLSAANLGKQPEGDLQVVFLDDFSAGED